MEAAPGGLGKMGRGVIAAIADEGTSVGTCGEDWWRGLVAVDEREWMARERWISGSAVGW